jgi:hypothetical protein
MRFGRGDSTPLPGYEENDYVPAMQAVNSRLKVATRFRAIGSHGLRVSSGPPFVFSPLVTGA